MEESSLINPRKNRSCLFYGVMILAHLEKVGDWPIFHLQNLNCQVSEVADLRRKKSFAVAYLNFEVYFHGSYADMAWTFSIGIECDVS